MRADSPTVTAASTNPQPRRVNHWFTAAAVFGGVLFGAHFGDAVRPEQDAVAAQSGHDSNVPPPFNAAGDRKALIDALSEANQRLARIEATLKTGINVKVTEMPAIKESK